MRRAHPPRPNDALRECQRMLLSKDGLRLLLPALPAGSTLEDARRFRKRLKQEARPRCSFLDAALGIVRD